MAAGRPLLLGLDTATWQRLCWGVTLARRPASVSRKLSAYSVDGWAM